MCIRDSPFIGTIDQKIVAGEDAQSFLQNVITDSNFKGDVYKRQAVLSKVPFVTTAKGVEGIDFKDGEDCLIVDYPAGFAEAVIALSSNCLLYTSRCV